MDNRSDDEVEQHEEEDQEQINQTILEFLATFHNISTEPQSIADLTDGVALFEALSEMYVVLVSLVSFLGIKFFQFLISDSASLDFFSQST
jgi:hypothetical protein